MDVGQNLRSQSSRVKTGASADLPANKKDILHLRGTLVEGGAECQRFRTSDNRFFTLTGDLRGFRTGDIVEITGEISQVSHCMQDTTIRVLTIRKPKASAPQKKACSVDFFFGDSNSGMLSIQHEGGASSGSSANWRPGRRPVY